MATLTIRKLEDDVKERLRVRAARAGRSMEEEARLILTSAVGGLDGPGLLERAQALFGDEGVEVELPERGSEREPVDFES